MLFPEKSHAKRPPDGGRECPVCRRDRYHRPISRRGRPGSGSGALEGGSGEQRFRPPRPGNRRFGGTTPAAFGFLQRLVLEVKVLLQYPITGPKLQRRLGLEQAVRAAAR